MKKYTKPEMKVVVLKHQSQILTGSGPTMLMNRTAVTDPEDDEQL